MRHGFIDDSDLTRRLAITQAQSSPKYDGHLHHVKILRPHNVEVDGWVRAGSGPSRYGDVVLRPSAAVEDGKRKAGALNSGQGTDTFLQTPYQGTQALVTPVTRRARADSYPKHVLLIETHIHGLQIRQAAQEQSRSRKQYQRQGHLAHHKSACQAVAHAGANHATTRFQRGSQVESSRTQRGSGTKQEHRQDRNGHRKAEYSRVGRDSNRDELGSPGYHREH